MLTMTEGPFAFVVKKYEEEYLIPNQRELRVNRHRLAKLKEQWGPKGTLSLSDVDHLMMVHKEHWNKATKARYLAMLKHLIGWAMERGLMTGELKLKIEVPKGNRTRRLHDEEEERLMGAMDRDLKDLFIAAMDTGLRRGTLFKLKMMNVEGGMVLVVPADIQKQARPQRIPLTKRMREVVSRRSLHRDKMSLLFESSGWREKWDKARSQAGVEGLHWHDLRGEFASRLAERGVPIHTISRLLDHSTLDMTQKYLRNKVNDFGDAIAKLEPLENDSD